MASFGDTYTLKLLDQITKPLRSVEQSMRKVVDVMDRMDKIAQKGLGLAKIAGAAGLAIVGLKGLSSVVGGLMDLLESGARLAANFGRSVIEATKFRAQSIASLDIFEGEGKGEGIFRKALKIGGITPADERDVVKQVTELRAAGYKGRGLSLANAALLDVGAVFGQEKQEKLAYYFKKFFGGRKVEADDFRMASFDAGLQENDVMRRVLTQQGVKPSDDNIKMGKQFDALKKQGKINGQSVVQALLDGINEKLDKGEGLGFRARKMGEGTLAGLMSNLEAAPQRFLMEMNLEKMPGIQSLMNFLKRLLVFFDHATPQGKKLAAVVEKMINTLFGGLDKIGDKDLARFFESGIAVAQRMIKVVESLWGFIDKMMHGSWSDVLSGAAGFLADVGKLIGAGIWQGFKAAMLGNPGGPSAQFTPNASVNAGASARGAIGSSLAAVPGAVWGGIKGVGAGISSAAGGIGAGMSGIGGALSSGFRDIGVGMGLVKRAEAVGAQGAQGLIKGAAGPSGLDNRSPSHKLQRVGAQGAEGLIKGAQERLDEQGAALLDALVGGVQRRAQQLQEGGQGTDDLLDGLVAILRGSLLRTGGAAVPA